MDADENFGVNRCGIEEGTVIYEVTRASGYSDRVETITLSWKEYGARVVKQTQTRTKSESGVSETNTRLLSDGEWVYNIDLDQGSAKRNKKLMGIYLVLEIQMKNLSSRGVNTALYGREAMERRGAKNKGTDTVAGMECEIWLNESSNIERCIRNGVILGEIMHSGETPIVYLATEVSEQALPDDAFELPKDLEISGSVDPMAMVRQMGIEMPTEMPDEAYELPEDLGPQELQGVMDTIIGMMQLIGPQWAP